MKKAKVWMSVILLLTSSFSTPLYARTTNYQGTNKDISRTTTYQSTDKGISNTTTYLDESARGTDHIYPTEDYDIQIKIDKSAGTEEYIYYDRYGGTATCYVVENKKVIEKRTYNSDFHPYDLLYKEGSNVVPPDRENVCFSYVTLPDVVDFIPQKTTGKMGYVNCAPSTTAMIYNWAKGLDNDNGLTAQWIRDTYPSEGEQALDGKATPNSEGVGYKISEVSKIFKDLGLDVHTSGFYTGAYNLYEWLNQGYILSLAVNLDYLPTAKIKQSNIDKSYKAGGAHSVVCTGYLTVIVEDEETGETRETTYLEIIDPWEDSVQTCKRYYNVESFENMLQESSCKFIAVKKQ